MRAHEVRPSLVIGWIDRSAYFVRVRKRRHSRRPSRRAQRVRQCRLCISESQGRLWPARKDLKTCLLRQRIASLRRQHLAPRYTLKCSRSSLVRSPPATTRHTHHNRPFVAAFGRPKHTPLDAPRLCAPLSSDCRQTAKRPHLPGAPRSPSPFSLASPGVAAFQAGAPVALSQRAHVTMGGRDTFADNPKYYPTKNV